MRLTKRTLLAGVGTLAAGAGVIGSTGAFTAVDADRSVSVSTSGDANALVGLTPGAGGEDYVLDPAGGTIAINISETAAGGAGVNKNAVTAIDELLTVTNNSENPITVGFNDPVAIDEDDYAAPPGSWAYAGSSPTEPTALAVLWVSPPPAVADKPLTEIRPETNKTGFGGSSSLIDGRTAKSLPDGGYTITPGEVAKVGIVIDTRTRIVSKEPIPEALGETIEFYATGQ